MTEPSSAALWKDGANAVEQALWSMDLEQRSNFLHRCIELVGNIDILVGDLNYGPVAPGSLQFTTLHEETSDD
ncbi:hypothetical protein [Streptomyces sp. bgisy095]|uniref:hypothetical protein n=1 Tax=unclassified Streptomyces TaxID=2593676 RepID=UPI003D7559FC